MIDLKTKEEIEIMQKSGKILAEVLEEVLSEVRPGISELELDQLAEKLILEKGAESGFKKVDGYKHTICISTNDTVVHGIPTDYRLKEGDVVGIDCGVFYKGLHTDMAETIRVKSSTRFAKAPARRELKVKSDEVDRFWQLGKGRCGQE